MKSKALRDEQLAAQIERAPQALRDHVQHLNGEIAGLRKLLAEMRDGSGPSNFSYRDVRDSSHLARESRIMLPQHAHLDVFEERTRRDELHLNTVEADSLGPRRLLIRATLCGLIVKPEAANCIAVYAEDYRDRHGRA